MARAQRDLNNNNTKTVPLIKSSQNERNGLRPSKIRPKHQKEIRDHPAILIPGGLTCPPVEKPPFTLKQLRDAIPSHCFHRSLPRSMFYMIRDLVLITINLYLSRYIHDLSPLLQLPLWSIYWLMQTGALAGIFVLAHDSCHDAFSKYPLVNDLVGIFLDSIILIPYLGFKYAHHKHHRFTASYQFDNAHPPPQKNVTQVIQAGEKEDKIHWREILQGNFVFQVISLCIYHLHFSLKYFLVLWYKSDELIGKKVTLICPTSTHPFRTLRDILTAALADLMFFGNLILVLWAAGYWGVWKVFLAWGLPVIIFWISFGFVTFMQHTDVYVPWYGEPEWSWMRGCMSTVDRSLGTLLDILTHDVAQYHTVHHLFPQIPFYNGREATEAVKPILGKYYLRDDTNFLVSLHRAFLNCTFVQEGSKIAFQRNLISRSCGQ